MHHEKEKGVSISAGRIEANPQDVLFKELFSFINAFHTIMHEVKKGNPMLREVTSLQYDILEYMAVEQPLTMSKISDCMGLSMPNASRELRKLTDKGMCERVDDPEDGRKQYITLSPLGLERMSEAFAYMREQFMSRVEGVPEEKLAETAEALKLLQVTFFRPIS
ncbi:MarR family transcriptional regulator [Paenibacillus sp. J5C_2022]|uniref:MarR family winged helix-turn-helix transcriptional regulator n=1 Tax=Paenibacillus sp. J5C2022 TaxID=2977129 RepID=UPI0021CF93E5|nr:MarR family transcriptional regulator [Paenibacillus sp. J5C2022]MCU6710189.1 MarR family transcriptional regulator [Paenibacillus sp. J5C2022]